MPITIMLSEGVRRRETEINKDILRNIIQALQDVFRFSLKSVEIWRNDTSKSLGGELIQSWENDGKDDDVIYSDTIPYLFKSNILRFSGNIEKPVKCSLEVEFNIWSPARKVYSDVLIDTAPTERSTIVDLLWLEEGQSLSIDFISRIAKIRTLVDGRNRKTVSEAVISPIVGESDQFEIDDYIGFYSSKGKPYLLLKRVLTGSTKRKDNGKNIAAKIGLFNVDKFSRRVYELGIVRKKFEVVDQRVSQLPIGSIFFKARDRSSFSSFVNDVNENIILPSVQPLESEDEILKKIEDNLKRVGVKTFDE